MSGEKPPLLISRSFTAMAPNEKWVTDLRTFNMVRQRCI